MATENPAALKHLYGAALLRRMATAMHDVYPAFDRKRWQALLPELEALEMKPRVQRLREELRRQLPKEYPAALRILLQSARSKNLGGFDLWPHSDFVQTYGLDHLPLSLDALKELTPKFSSEFAVRPYLKRHPEATLRFLEKCARDGDVHVRRWASEGSRPRLPWGERLHDFVRDPAPTLRIVELLRWDPELYVRKSVSNHLNDIAKDHPGKVLQTLAAWKKSASAEHADKVTWIIQRALRTLIKSGDPQALQLIGVSSTANIACDGLTLNQKKFKIGDRLEFAFRIRSMSRKPQKLVIDYVLHYVKSNQSTSPKVFKLKNLVLPPQGEIFLTKQHHLKEVTTRVHYPGTHVLEIQVNGQRVGRVAWDLKLESGHARSRPSP